MVVVWFLEIVWYGFVVLLGEVCVVEVVIWEVL